MVMKIASLLFAFYAVHVNKGREPGIEGHPEATLSLSKYSKCELYLSTDTAKRPGDPGL
jgi:hypothetical protein